MRKVSALVLSLRMTEGLNDDIFVQKKDFNGAQAGDKVVVKNY